MHKLHLLSVFALVLVASAFTRLVQPTEKFTVSVSDSKVHWLAKKITGQHEGDILLKSGEVTFEKKKLKGGSFEIDMTSITCTDIKDAGTNKKLLGHLKSVDFFSTSKFTTATLKITKATQGKGDEYEVTADLTIKGKTAPVTFKTTVSDENKTVKAKATIIFDRTKYDIRYGSSSFFEGLGDRAIYNDVEITIAVVAKEN